MECKIGLNISFIVDVDKLNTIFLLEFFPGFSIFVRFRIKAVVVVLLVLDFKTPHTQTLLPLHGVQNLGSLYYY